MKPLRVNREMRADVFDTLELVSEFTGGVRSDAFSVNGVPYDLHGMAAFACEDEHTSPAPGNPVGDELKRLGITYGVSDKAVENVRDRLGLDSGADVPVPFRELMRELSVVRIRAAA